MVLLLVLQPFLASLGIMLGTALGPPVAPWIGAGPGQGQLQRHAGRAQMSFSRDRAIRVIAPLLQQTISRCKSQKVTAMTYHLRTDPECVLTPTPALAFMPDKLTWTELADISRFI